MTNIGIIKQADITKTPMTIKESDLTAHLSPSQLAKLEAIGRKRGMSVQEQMLEAVHRYAKELRK